MIFAIIVFIVCAIIFAYIINDENEKKKIEEYTARMKQRNQYTEENKTNNTNENYYSYTKDEDIKKWLYVYDNLEEIKETIDSMNKKISLMYTLVIIQLIIAIVSLLLKISVGAGAIGIVNNIL